MGGACLLPRARSPARWHQRQTLLGRGVSRRASGCAALAVPTVATPRRGPELDDGWRVADNHGTFNWEWIFSAQAPLDLGLDEVLEIVQSPLSEKEFRRHPLIVLLFSHGSRGWEDSL